MTRRKLETWLLYPDDAEPERDVSALVASAREAGIELDAPFDDDVLAATTVAGWLTEERRERLRTHARAICRMLRGEMKPKVVGADDAA